MMEDKATHARLQLRAIERRRKELHLTKDYMERAANLTRGHYYRLVVGHCTPRAATIARLRAALANATKQRKPAVTEDEVAIAYRLAVTLVAMTMGRDPSSVHRHDPSRRATHNPEWMSAAEVRRTALYLLTSAVGLNQARAGQAAGMTRQAVSLACRAIEEKREDRDFNRMLDELTAAVMGEW